MTYLLTLLTYFFEPLPSGPFKYMNILIAVAATCIVAAIALRIYLKKQKEDKIFRKLFRELPGKLLFFALTELVYVLVRYERMPYLSIRFLNYMILAYGLYILVMSAKNYLKIYPAAKQHHDNQVKMNQYLPRKKH